MLPLRAVLEFKIFLFVPTFFQSDLIKHLTGRGLIARRTGPIQLGLVYKVGRDVGLDLLFCIFRYIQIQQT